jgi:hypothetical protein
VLAYNPRDPHPTPWFRVFTSSELLRRMRFGEKAERYEACRSRRRGQARAGVAVHVAPWRTAGGRRPLERDSADDAEQTRRDVLRDVQSPLVARTETEDLGDAAYVAPGGGGAYFAPANLVMVVRDAGDATSVLDAAHALDPWVTAVP